LVEGQALRRDNLDEICATNWMRDRCRGEGDDGGNLRLAPMASMVAIALIN